MKKNHYVVVDIETGGSCFLKNPITEIAAYDVEPIKFKVMNKYTAYIKPYNDLEIEQDALDYSKITLDLLNREGKIYSVVVSEFIMFLKLANSVKGGKGREFGNPIFLAHNAFFDFSFINELFKLANEDIFQYISRTVADTLFLSKLTWDEEIEKGGIDSSHKLSSACERANIKMKDAHRAENDVIATSKLLNYFGGRIRNKISTSSFNVENVNEEYNDESNYIRETFEF